MTWAFLEDARDRMCRKVEPVIYLDLETRAHMLDDHGEVLAIAYKIGDEPVVVLPWEAACARKDWAEAERLQREMFAEIKRRNQVEYYENLGLLDKSWLTRKFLTFTAWTRKLLSR